jgi:kynurenine/2-aminoadipate aminotransferase
MPHLAKPGMISLSGGHPNPETFPFASIDVTLRSGAQLALRGAKLDEALQYGSSYGMPDLVRELAALQQREHVGANSAGKFGTDWSLIVGTGSQDVIDRAFWTVLNEEDAVLVETPCYPGIIASLNGIGARKVEVPADHNGVRVDELDRVLANWSGPQRRPRVLYTVSIGQNPTGASLSVPRRHELLAVARKYDLLIFEDDPYYYLQFVEPRLPSLWSLDADGRVLRFDSLSKVLSAGLRIGWCTGPHALVEQIQLSMQASALQASGVTQMLVAATLQEWGADGWRAHIDRVSHFYKARRDYFVGLCEQHLTGLATWAVPQGGMFLWFEVIGVDDSSTLMAAAIEQNVLLVPGAAFLPNGGKSGCLRATYSIATEENMEIAIKRLAKLLREHKKE